MAETQAVGKRLPRVDGVAKVTGRAQYAGDVILPGMLHAKVLRTRHPHAKIVRLDTSKAEAMPGVRAVITAKDLPKVDEGRLAPVAGKGGLFEGEAVAAVAADTPEIAADAIAAIEVEYEALPATTNLKDALVDDAPLVHASRDPQQDADGNKLHKNIQSYRRNKRGDVEKAFAEADWVQEDTYHTQVMHQGYLEPRACVCAIGPDSTIEIWTSTQSQFSIREGVAGYFGVPLTSVNVRAMTLGGGFGGKGGATIEPIAVGLARKSARPVRLILTRHEEFLCGRPRGEMILTIKTGVTNDGAITGRSIQIYGNGGAYGSGFGGMASPLAIGPYKVDAWQTEVFGVNTHSAVVGAHRAPGGPQAAFACESHMDAIAHKLGMDPVEFRLKNLVEEGDFVFGGEEMPPSAWRKTITSCVERAQWAEKRASKKANRGIGIACGMWRGHAGRSAASVSANEDGSFRVIHGAIDMCGTDTALTQIAADTLGVPIDRVRVIMGDTNSTAIVEGTWGSRTTYGQGTAVKRACEQVRRQIEEASASEWGVDAADVKIDGDEVICTSNGDLKRTLKEAIGAALGRNGSVVGHGAVSSLPLNPALNCQIVELEVDPETGFVDILNLVTAQDVGRAINPAMVEGQLEGGAVQGLGFALWEEYIYEPTNGSGNGQSGKLLNPNFLDYRMPTIPDVGNIESIVVEMPVEHGPFGAKGVGEAPIVPTAAAVANAIEDAVGVRMTDLPITPEKLRRAIQENGGK